MAFRKTLYHREKGKQMHATGTYKLSRTENIIMNIFMYCFAASVILMLVKDFFDSEILDRFSWIFFDFSFGGLIIYAIAVVLNRSRNQPLDAHYYDVDYKYDGIKGEVEDNDKEISKEEFFGKKED